MATGSDVRKIHRRLEREHGPLDPPRRIPPLDELVLTILSQNTSDLNRDRAWRAMRDRFPTWEAVEEAPVDEVIDAIRPGGLANTKAPRIQAVLREIRAREGGIDLSWMADASDAEVEEYLVSLPGVGRKTAACVLAFSLERDAIPVDTHVFRVGKRLGLIGERSTADRAHRELRDLVPPELRVPFHVALIRHGRTICRAGMPRCESCPVRDLCPSADTFLEAGSKAG